MRLHSLLAWVSAGVVLSSFATFACSSDDKKSDSSTGDDTTGDDTTGDDTTGDDATGDDDTAPVGDSGTPAVINDCTTFVDKTTETTLSVTWADPLPDGEPLCLTVKKGTVVTFATKDGQTFASHPLVGNGDTPNPITGAESGTSKPFTLASTGNFGFKCNFHSNMRGVFRVVE